MSATEDLFRSYLDLRWHFDPSGASAAGVTGYDDRLGDYSAEAMRAHLAAFQSIAGAVEQLDVEAGDEEIEQTAFLDEVRIMIARFQYERPHVHDPGFWLSHLFSGFHTLLRRRYQPEAERARALLARLRETPRFLERARATLKHPPRVFLETARQMARAAPQVVGDAVALIRRHLPPDETTDRAVTEAEVAVTRFTTALGSELAAHPDDLSFAIGEDQFNRRLHHEHALQAGAPELYRYGLHLVEEVSAEVVALARQIDPTTSWRTVVERLRARYEVGPDLLGAFQEAVSRSHGFLEARGLFTMPDGVLDVLETPDFLRPVIPFAAYEPPGPFAPERRGTFYVTTLLDGENPSHGQHGLLEIAATAVHEAWPGHHLQMLTAQAQPSLIRQVLWTPITVEGWALYAEELMAEQGFFASVEERLFHRLHLLWRGVRILLDVGLHTRGMTPEEATDTLVDRVGMDRSHAAQEVSRYCAWPTYQLCYAVGRREILQLREDWRARAGSDDLRVFHDATLAWGGLPISLIRWGMGLEE